MNNRIGLAPAGIAVLAAAALGAGSAWTLAQRSAEHSLLDVMLARELEATDLCVNSLKLNAANDRELLARLLEKRLDSAVTRAANLTREGVRPDVPVPNLRESVRRAADYYSAAGQVAGQQRAETLLARLNENPE